MGVFYELFFAESIDRIIKIGRLTSFGAVCKNQEVFINAHT